MKLLPLALLFLNLRVKFKITRGIIIGMLKAHVLESHSSRYSTRLLETLSINHYFRVLLAISKFLE